MKKYIQLDYSQFIGEGYTDVIRFISKDEFNYNLIGIIKEFYKNIMGGKEEEFNKILKKIMLENGGIVEDYGLLEEDYKYILDYKEEFNQYITNEELEELCNELSLYIDTVGYSPWCYYIAPDEKYHQLANDLWNGYNFYDIDILDEKGGMVDCLANCYITSNEDLKIYADEYFGISENDILLVENSCSEYFDFKKVTKQVKEYEFLEK